MLTPLTGLAHSGATGVVKQRMDIMKQFKKDMKVVRKMVKGEVSVDAQSISQIATYIEESAASLPDLFPPDSNPHPSEADNMIWQQWEQFLDSFKLMSQQARLLQQAAAAGTDDSLADGFRKLSDSCSQCHDLYRQEF